MLELVTEETTPFADLLRQNREDRVRRRLEDVGCILVKSPVHDPDAPAYGGWMILSRSGVVYRGNDSDGGFTLDLSQVEGFLQGQEYEIAAEEEGVEEALKAVREAEWQLERGEEAWTALAADPDADPSEIKAVEAEWVAAKEAWEAAKVELEGARASLERALR